jgi:hypothetical protein
VAIGRDQQGNRPIDLIKQSENEAIKVIFFLTRFQKSAGISLLRTKVIKNKSNRKMLMILGSFLMGKFPGMIVSTHAAAPYAEPTGAGMSADEATEKCYGLFLRSLLGESLPPGGGGQLFFRDGADVRRVTAAIREEGYGGMAEEEGTRFAMMQPERKMSVEEATKGLHGLFLRSLLGESLPLGGEEVRLFLRNRADVERVAALLLDEGYSEEAIECTQYVMMQPRGDMSVEEATDGLYGLFLRSLLDLRSLLEESLPLWGEEVQLFLRNGANVRRVADVLHDKGFSEAAIEGMVRCATMQPRGDMSEEEATEGLCELFLQSLLEEPLPLMRDEVQIFLRNGANLGSVAAVLREGGFSETAIKGAVRCAIMQPGREMSAEEATEGLHGLFLRFLLGGSLPPEGEEVQRFLRNGADVECVTALLRKRKFSEMAIRCAQRAIMQPGREMSVEEATDGLYGLFFRSLLGESFPLWDEAQRFLKSGANMECVAALLRKWGFSEPAIRHMQRAITQLGREMSVEEATNGLHGLFLRLLYGECGPFLLEGVFGEGVERFFRNGADVGSVTAVLRGEGFCEAAISGAVRYAVLRRVIDSIYMDLYFGRLAEYVMLQLPKCLGTGVSQDIRKIKDIRNMIEDMYADEEEIPCIKKTLLRNFPKCEKVIDLIIDIQVNFYK